MIRTLNIAQHIFLRVGPRVTVNTWNEVKQGHAQSVSGWEQLLALLAAPPLIMDFTKMPRSAWFSLDRLPLTLTPRPAEPESLRGISKVMNSCVPSGVNTMSSSSECCWYEGQRRREKVHNYHGGGAADANRDICTRLRVSQPDDTTTKVSKLLLSPMSHCCTQISV